MKRRKDYLTFKTFLYLIAVIITTLLLFTTFYGLSYLIILGLTLRYLPKFEIFKTHFGRFVLTFLLLAASVMLAGLLAWGLHTPTHPTLVAIFYLSIVAVLFHVQEDRSLDLKLPLIDRGDIISITLALVAPIIIFLSFFFKDFSFTPLYQLVSTGWDHANHILMIETASIEKGYTYGPTKELLPKTIINSGTYPQAWHLSSANIANGFGGNVFSPTKPFTVLIAYTIVALTWFVLAAYLLSITAWRLVEPKLKSGVLENQIVTILLFSLANLLIQFGTIWGSIVKVGHSNYIGFIAFFIAAIAIIIGSKKKDGASYITALLLGVAAILCWFLPLPAIALMLLAAYWGKGINIKTIRPMWKPTYVATVLAAIISVVPVIVFILFSDVDGISGQSQLNTGTGLNNISGMNAILLIMTIVTLAYWLKARTPSNFSLLQNKIVAIVGSMTIFLAILYAYQMLSKGITTYYFGKIFSLSMIALGVFFISAFTIIIGNLSLKNKISPLSTLILGSAVVGLLFIAFISQQLNSIDSILQRKSRIEHSTAKAVANYMQQEDPSKVYLVILRNKSYEDTNTNLHLKTAHKAYPVCISNISGAKNAFNLEGKLATLDLCASKINKKILVITSNDTKDAVKALDNPNIRIVNVP